MLKAVTLDFWDTLFISDDDPEHRRRQDQRLVEELVALGEPRSQAAIRDALRGAHRWFAAVWHNERRTPSASETLDVAFAALGVSPPSEVVVRTAEFFAHLALNLPPELVPGVPLVLAQLASRYELAIIADTGYAPGSVLRELLSRHDLLQFFDCTCFSNERGISKPDRRVFDDVLAELGARPSEAVHVGDSQRTDITGGQTAGMWTVHFLGANDSDAAVSTADARIRRFAELPVVLDSLAGS